MGARGRRRQVGQPRRSLPCRPSRHPSFRRRAPSPAARPPAPPGPRIASGRTGGVIAAAIEVHRHLGPGLLEAAYQGALARELELRGLPFERELALPLVYKGLDLACEYRIDLCVARALVVEVKAVASLLSVHEAQLLTYMKLGRSYGNGPAWAAIVEYLGSKDAALRSLELDDESDALLVRSTDMNVLDSLRQRLLDLALHPAALRAVIRDARASGFGHGDL